MTLSRIPSGFKGWVSSAIAPAVSLTEGSRGRVLKNASALMIAQVAGYILPLFVLPYTAIILGPAVFGMLALTQAAVMQCTMAVNYGFPYSATRMVALVKDDREQLASILVNVWGAKSLLMLTCLIVSLLAFGMFHQLRYYLLAYACAFVSVIGTVFYPDWFFQGVEEMKWITVNSVIPKLLILPLIFVFVKRPSDYWKFLLIQSMNSVVSGVAGVILCRRWLGVRLPIPRARLVLVQLKSGWVTFLSCASLNFNGSINTLLLGALTNPVAVGCYSAAQKVVNALQMLWNAGSQALYPFFCNKFRVNVKAAAAKLRQLLYLVAGTTLVAAVVACASAHGLVAVLFGAKYSGTVPVFQVLMFLFCASSVSSLLGMQGLLGMGLERDYLRITGTGVILNVVFSFFAIKFWGGIGLATAVVLLEIIVAAREAHVLRCREVF